MRCPECGSSNYTRRTRTPEWLCSNRGYESSDPKSRIPDVASAKQEFSMPSLVPTAIERQPCFVRYWNKCPDANMETPATVSAGILVFGIPLIAVALILVWLLIQMFFGLSI